MGVTHQLIRLSSGFIGFQMGSVNDASDSEFQLNSSGSSSIVLTERGVFEAAGWKFTYLKTFWL